MRCGVDGHQYAGLVRLLGDRRQGDPRVGADGTLDREAACGRARQHEEPRDFDACARRLAKREVPGRSADAPTCTGKNPAGLSLDRMREYPSWPADGLDPYPLAVQRQVIRVVPMVAVKGRGACGSSTRRLRSVFGGRWRSAAERDEA
jgi:hypothetical protein